MRSRPPLELWGGSECTVHRLGDRFHDQTVLNGHERRSDDLAMFAALGLTTLRYPVLWERIAPADPAACDWRWTDARLARIRALGMTPVAGLVHHGSGPAYTSLVDPAFPDKLAGYAARVAARYPWIEAYTPVNEPLTTARFSALYGHWHPHARDHPTFLAALLNQVRGVVAAMRAVRRVNPAARLVQTEDLGKTFSTRALAYQARFENERRWLTFDLLTGRVGPGHALWDYIEKGGLDGAFRSFQDDIAADPCPPDVIGINHYLSSERFLDHRLARYPREAHGGNEFHRYADVLALRVLTNGPDGPERLLMQAWRRYRRPMAVTEAHNGCTRKEQMRWLLEVWEGAEAARAQGADIRAVTAWALLGSFDWNSLLTRMVGHYEPGVYDLRGDAPRETAVAHMLRALAAGRRPDHPVLDMEGWWHRPDRLHFPPVAVRRAPPRPPRRAPAPRRLLIVGKTGTLGGAFAPLCVQRGLPHVLASRQDADITDPRSIARTLEEHRPWAVINAAGYVRVDDAETAPEPCRRDNEIGAGTLAKACAGAGIPLVTFSTDLVFDGAKKAPYVEDDPVAPLCVYGRTKAAAERAVLASCPQALVIRTSAFFGPWDDHNFVTLTLRALGRGESVAAAQDSVVSPTYVPHLVDATLDLLIDGAAGLWHLSNEGAVSWAELAQEAAGRAGLPRELVRPVPRAEMPWRAKRPAYSALASRRGRLMPPIEAALDAYFQATGARERAA